MSMIKEEIKDFAENNQIVIKEINNDKCLKIRKAVNELYVDSKKKGLWLWDRLNCFASLADAEGWGYIKEFVSDNNCIMFFNEFDEKSMFNINNGNDLFSLLSGTSGFEFYITDDNCTYLIGFNHHDVLYGCGKAIKWIDGLKK